VLAVTCAACDEDPTASRPVCTDQPTVAVGTAVQATLLAGDARLAGAYIDYYALRLDTPTRLTLRVVSVEIDPLILIFDETGQVTDQAFDDDPPQGTGEATVTLTRELGSGCTLIGVSSFEPDDPGAYTLAVDPAP
jgi:hypothetical protein